MLKTQQFLFMFYSLNPCVCKAINLLQCSIIYELVTIGVDCHSMNERRTR